MSDFGEKYPWALRSKQFFFGLFTIQFWEYRCILTHAQIELMCTDKARIKYNTSKSGGKCDPKKPNRKAIEETIKAWNERKKKEAEEAANKSNQTI